MTSSSTKTIFTSALLVMVGKVISSSSVILERSILGQYTSVSQYGKIAVAIAIFQFSLVFSVFGLEQTVAKYTPHEQATSWKQNIWITGMVISLIISSLSVLFQLALYPIYDQYLPMISLEPFILMMVSVPFVSGLRVSVGAARGINNASYRTIAQDTIYPGLRVGLLYISFIFGLGILGIGVSYFVSAIVGIVTIILFLRTDYRRFRDIEIKLAELLRYSAPVMLSTFIVVILNKFDVLMISYFVNSTEVGLYEAAFPLAYGIVVLSSSFGYSLLPITSSLQESKKDVNEIYKTTIKWMYIVSIPVFIIQFSFSSDVLRIIFTNSYTPAAPMLKVLSAGFLVNAAFGRNREILTAIGDIHPVLLINVFAVISNIIMNIFLIPILGGLGASIASVTTYTLINVISEIHLRRKHNLTAIYRENLLFEMKHSILLAGFFVPLSYVIGLNIISLFLVSFIAASLSVILALYIGEINDHDREIIRDVESRLGLKNGSVTAWFE